MNKRLLLSSCLIGLFVLIVLVQNQKPLATGEIQSLTYNNDITLIKIKNLSEEIIVFDFLYLENNASVQVYGKREFYKNKTQIIADKITR
jgi:hypothetical protein